MREDASMLAEAHVLAGDIDAAADAAQDALALAAATASARTDARIERLRHLLSSHPAVAAVRDFEEACQAAGLGRGSCQV